MSGQLIILQAELQRPNITTDDAAELLYSFYGLQGSIIELGSQQVITHPHIFGIEAGLKV